MSTAQQKYSAYDRELLLIYEAVKHSRHMLEARRFVIFNEHKPLTYVFSHRRDKCTPRQFNHLDYISQFTTDIRHISGQDNVVADAVSRGSNLHLNLSRNFGRSTGNRHRTHGPITRDHRPLFGEDPGSWLGCGPALRHDHRQTDGTPSHALLMDSWLRMPAKHHHRPGPAIRIAALPLPGQNVRHPSVPHNGFPPSRQRSRGADVSITKGRHYVPDARALDRGPPARPLRHTNGL